jgi:hypothetical protein
MCELPALDFIPNIKVREIISSEMFFGDSPNRFYKKCKEPSIEHRLITRNGKHEYILYEVVELLANSVDE